MPSSKAYKKVKVGVHDDVTIRKLSFFSYIARLMKPYLRMNQCEKRMLVLKLKDLKKMVLGLVRVIVKDSVIDGKTLKQLVEVDLENSENMLTLKDMNLGFATEALLRELQKKDTVTTKQLTEFREEARMLVLATLKKLIEKSPLSSSFVCLLAVFIQPPNLKSHEGNPV